MSLLKNPFVASVVTLALASSAFSTAPAHAAEADPVDLLRSAQLEGTARGDVTARENLTAIDALTISQRRELGTLLASGASIIEPTEEAVETQMQHASVLVDGDARWTTEAVSTAEGRAIGSRSIAATQTMTFLGITLTEVKTWGKYTVEAPRVLRVTDWGTQVVRNYQPLTSVSASKQSAVISGGDVTFKAKVTVKRGPAPGLGGSWSSRTAYHTVKANYIGTIKSNGWS